MCVGSASPGSESAPKGEMERSLVRTSERGAGTLKAIFWVAVLVAMIYAGIKVGPVLFNEFELQDAMQTTARFATVNRQSPDDIRKTVITEAAKEDITLQPSDIQVTSEAGNVQINAAYTVTVDLQVYQLTLNFHPSAKNNAL